jgi:hypothetical protein
LFVQENVTGSEFGSAVLAVKLSVPPTPTDEPTIPGTCEEHNGGVFFKTVQVFV